MKDKKRAVFYLPKGSENDATSYYVGIVKSAFRDLGYTVESVHQLRDIKKADIILTIEAKTFFFCKMLNPRTKIINWFQGVVPEEIKMRELALGRVLAWRFWEFFTLKLNAASFFVSDAMKMHYEKTYHLGNLNNKTLVMPCFNAEYETVYFNELNRYEQPCFVYIGSLSKWQCIEKTLIVFSEVQERLPTAELAILTREIDKAKSLIDQYNIKNVIVKYVQLDELPAELSKYKYGFLIRDKHIVNEVSTPTKMSTYLASGVIPIYTDAVDAFVKNIILDEFNLIFRANEQEKVMAEKIVELEAMDIDYSKLCEKIGAIFQNFYSEVDYKKNIKEFLQKVLV